MGIPSMSDLANYEPRWPGVVELNLGDQWRARWVDEQEMAPNAPVAYVYAAVYMGDNGYLTRRAGEDHWNTVEGPLPPNERPEAFVRRATKEQTGAVADKVVLVGFLECRATSHNPDHEPGAITVRPVYLVVAKQVNDVPAGSPSERRRLPINQHVAFLRQRYPELREHLARASERYMVMRAKGEA